MFFFLFMTDLMIMLCFAGANIAHAPKSLLTKKALTRMLISQRGRYKQVRIYQMYEAMLS
jgi:hypothetical protein